MLSDDDANNTVIVVMILMIMRRIKIRMMSFNDDGDCNDEISEDEVKDVDEGDDVYVDDEDDDDDDDDDDKGIQ